MSPAAFPEPLEDRARPAVWQRAGAPSPGGARGGHPCEAV